ncbi:MAG: primase-helicase family protein [Rikenellaceae bacterium]
MYMFTPAHKGTRETGAKIDPTGLLPLDFDRLKDPDNFEAKAMASGAVFCKPSVSKGYHIAYMYNPEELEYNRALQMAVKWAKLHTGEAADPDALKEIQGFFIADKPAVIYEQGAVIDLAMAEWLEAISGGQETPTPPRTRTTEPPRPKRGRPRNSEAKMKGFLVECEFYHGLTPEDGSWNSCLRKWCEKVAGAGIDQDEAMEWARDPFAPRASCEREFTSMFTRAYKEVEDKEANKAKSQAEERAKLRENIGAGSLIDARGKDWYVARDGSISPRSPQWGKDYLGGRDLYAMRPSFEGLINAPDNLNFSYVVDDLFNVAAQVPKYEPKGSATPTIDALFSHIFSTWGDSDTGTQRGLDWVQIAYTNPAQKLPIIVLTSAEQGTGKTSFLHFLSLLFGRAAVDADVNSVTGQFTSHWAHAQIVMIDEQATNSREQAGFLKKYSTAKKIRYEAKGAPAEYVGFYGKFIIANNHQEKPVYLEEEDTRYIVLPVPTLEGKTDPDFMAKVEAEMGDFVEMLKVRELHTPKRGRLWFAPDELETEATRKAKKSSRSTMHEALDAMLDSMSEQLPEELLIFTLKTYRTYTESVEGLQWRQDSARVALERKGLQKSSRTQIVPNDWGDDAIVWKARKGANVRCWVMVTP